jgi:predicted nuclease of predicted toxin-antitoxin system
MKFVADESVDRQIVEGLQSKGHDVWYIAEMSPSISDNEVLALAIKHDGLLITSDKDFGELVFRKGLTSSGIILIRLSGMPPEQKVNIVTAGIFQRFNEMKGNFTVIGPKSIRIRKIGYWK